MVFARTLTISVTKKSSRALRNQSWIRYIFGPVRHWHDSRRSCCTRDDRNKTYKETDVSHHRRLFTVSAREAVDYRNREGEKTDTFHPNDELDFTRALATLLGSSCSCAHDAFGDCIWNNEAAVFDRNIDTLRISDAHLVIRML